MKMNETVGDFDDWRLQFANALRFAVECYAPVWVVFM